MSAHIPPWACTAPIRYIGHEALAQDIANLTRAAAKAGATQAFMPATAPGSASSTTRSSTPG